MPRLLNKVLTLGIASVLFYVSCASTRNRQTLIDYNNETSVKYEISVAEQNLENAPLKAFAKALVLRENTTGFPEVDTLYLKAVQACNKSFEEATTAQRWDEAIRYFLSLTHAGELVSGWTLERLKMQQQLFWQREGNEVLVQATTTQNNRSLTTSLSNTVIENALQGTVTVLVDRGMTIKNGVAYSDRLIGSAFFIDKRGYLLTNYHVIQSNVDPKYEGYSRVYIRTPDNTSVKIPAKVIGWDAVLDIALLKTELEPEFVFKFGSTKDIKLGSRVYAIGSPAGLERTITSGIVSAKNRKLLSVGSVLQIDAAINHGNSGGPLIDEHGNVQAIVFAGLEQNEGLNFAIPVELVVATLPALFAGGEVSHAWFGNFGHTILPQDQLQVSHGVVVDYILPFGPSSFSTMKEGDIITKINGIEIKSIEDIQDMLFNLSVGTIVKVEGLSIEKQGLIELQEKTYQPKRWFVQLDGRPELPGKSAYDVDVVSNVMLPLTGMKLELISGKSFRITDILRGSSADELGFAKNDYVELKTAKIDKETNIFHIQMYAKRRKSGYLDGFLGLYAYLDDPGYF